MKKFKNSMLLTAITTVFMLSACNQSQNTPATQTQQPSNVASDNHAATKNAVQMTIDTALGKKQLLSQPSPLAVYDAATLQNLAALDVPVDGMPNDLRLGNIKAANTPESVDIGTVSQPDFELLKQLSPQAIFVGQNLSEKIIQLEKIAPTYQLTDEQTYSLEQTKAQLTQLGELFHRSQNAEQIIKQLEESIETVKKQAQSQSSGLVLMIKNGELLAYDQDSAYGFVHTVFGVPMADAALTSGQPLSFAQLQKINPQWLFVIDYDSAMGQPPQISLLDNPDIQQLQAYQEHRIVYLSADAVLATGSYYHYLTDAQILNDAFSSVQ